MATKKTLDTNAAPATPEAAPAPAVNAASEAQAASENSAPAEGADTPAAVEKLKVKVSGAFTVAAEVAKGQSFRMALKEAGIATEVYNGNTYRDSANKPVSLDRVLNDNVEVTAVAKAAGG